ncbi:MAG: hypothetical protein HQK49_17220 [Oligoflexia bacterium]|nr:hypothetical protein [Oligoflexia bacterium]
MAELHSISLMNPPGRLSQGDIFREVEVIEQVLEQDGIIEVKKIVFPLAIVVSQDCDLLQHYRGIKKNTDSGESYPTSSKLNDKYLFSALLVPLFNAEYVKQGTYLDELERSSVTFNNKKNESTTAWKKILQNETPRYHYFEFPQTTPIVPQVADFKHFFTVNINYLTQKRQELKICTIDVPFREQVSHRFYTYLARIGTPAPESDIDLIEMVRFKVICDVGFGHAVFITGQDEMLGKWKTAYRLNYDRYQNIWLTDLVLRKNSEFKLIKAPWIEEKSTVITDGDFIWENSINGNRRIEGIQSYGNGWLEVIETSF